MISKNLYVQILVRVLLLASFLMFAGWVLFDQKWYVLSLVIFTIIVILIANLIWFLNTTNRRLFYFFDAIKNEDTNLSFPIKNNNKTINELTQSLFKVNKQIQQIQIENCQQEQYFQALLEHAATGIMTMNSMGFILHANSTVKRLFSLDVLTHVNQLKKINHKLFVSIKNIKPSEQRLITISNEKINTQLLIKANLFISDNNELVLLSVQDIKNELDEKELDSWLKLIRVMMHEIMNSIAPITSLSESLVHYFILGGRVKSPSEINKKTIETTIRGLEVIREQGKGLISFVESYRTLTHIPKPDRKIFEVRKLLDRIDILTDSFEDADKIEMDYQVNPKELEIFADEKQVSQVIINLVKNAFEANGDNPFAKVKIIARLNENRYPEICILDNGPGIPKEVIDKIFVPFFTTKESGSGIGLSLSRQIMQMHGGSLKVISSPGKITSAILSFKR